MDLGQLLQLVGILGAGLEIVRRLARMEAMLEGYNTRLSRLEGSKWHSDR